MANGIDLKTSVMQTSTYWVMDDVSPIGYATLKHKVDLSKPGGHFGCCLKKEYQNKGIGTIVANLLSEIALNDLGIEEVIFTSKNENEQSKRSVSHIGGTLIKVENGYHFYKVNIKEKLQSIGKGK
jgi:predicted acetyltransferase